jgi:hypothetical protein
MKTSDLWPARIVGKPGEVSLLAGQDRMAMFARRNSGELAHLSEVDNGSARNFALACDEAASHARAESPNASSRATAAPSATTHLTPRCLPPSLAWIGRDNVGKGLCPAGARSNLQGPAERGDAEAGWRATGLAHEPVRVTTKG